jgi:hypothetical protein
VKTSRESTIAEVKRVLAAFEARQPLPQDGDGPSGGDSGYYPFAAGYLHSTLSVIIMELERDNDQ